MKNLKLLTGQKKRLTAANYFCSDIEKNVYLATTKNVYLFDSNIESLITCGELPSESGEDGFVIEMDYIFETNSIFIATSVGDLYLYDITELVVSGVGFVEAGITALAWSPDQEFIVILTGANTLILMTKEFDPITEKSLTPDEFGESKPINVGWGSKTTQFHGSEGKDAALMKNKEPKQALLYDDHKPRISWRKDGEFFVISTVDKDRGYRMLRIWSQEAVLQFTSEIVEGLEEPVSWRPQGNVIACSQQSVNKHKVVFFEKNGLQHGEFVLPFRPNTYRVSTLAWNSDSSVLLVVAEEVGENASNCNVMLWSSSNYHWYLKHKFDVKIPSPETRLVAKWNAFNPHELDCFDPVSGDMHHFEWTWTTLHCYTNNDCDNSIVASIDNGNLLISTFAKLVVPPPLCSYMYSLESAIESVFFAPDRPSFGCYVGNCKIGVFQKDQDMNSVLDSESCKLKLIAAGGNGFKSQIKPYSFQGFYDFKIESNLSIFCLCHFTWINNHQLLCVGFCSESNKHFLLLFNLPPAFSSEEKLIKGSVLIQLEQSIVALCTNADGNSVALQSTDGRVSKVILDQGSVILKPFICDSGKELVYSKPCTNMALVSINDKNYVLGLNDKFNLFCNDLLLIPNCTSFCIHDEYILATTADHMLKCLSKDKDIPEAFVKKGVFPADTLSQSIEKGARIIVAPAQSTKVILQMPRGNLETIHPRPLMLSAICKHLDKLEFADAFNLSKVHRIDLNVLHDHNPELFLTNVEKIIDQVASPSDLNLILTSLKNEDVCLTTYSLMFKKIDHSASENTENKINVVCDAFRKVLETRDFQKYYQALMATYAKKDPPELDKALIMLKTLKDSGDINDMHSFIDKALSFLLYIVDVETLRLTALGTYDLEIAVMVEQKSQRDPKEFLPFYNSLQLLEENYRKYKIDLLLKRYKKALQHISNCENKFDECLALIKEQKLYTDAIHLFPKASERYKVVWREYGAYLMQKRYFEEAGLAFSRCENYESALLAYQESLNWQMALCCAAKLNYSDIKIASLCLELSRKLMSDQKYLDASYLLEHYVKDPEESIVSLLQGCEWKMALLMISKYKRDDIAETHLKPALKEHSEFLLGHLQQNVETFSKHSSRLKFLRTQKKVDAVQRANAPRFAEDDLYSDVGSVTDAASSCVESKQMSGSIMTRKSSKSRRKQKLKKYRLKEGSPDEDLALIAALSEIVAKVDSLKDNFLGTLKALLHFGYDDDAKKLQDAMTLTTDTIETELPIIWNPAENVSQSVPEMQYGPDSTVNSITASLNQITNPTTTTPKDPELAAPPWKTIDLTLQILK